MVGVVARGPVHEFPAPVGTGIGPGEHHRGSRFAEVQPAAVRVERTAGIGRERLERLEARDDETRLDLRPGHHDIVAAAGQEHPPGVDQGTQAGDAGVRHHQRRFGEAQRRGNVRSRNGDGDRRLVVAEFLHIALDGREDEGHPGGRAVDTGPADGVLRGKEHDRLEEIVAGQPFRGCVRGYQRTVEKRGAEGLGNAERIFLAGHAASSFRHGMEILLRRETQRGDDIAGYCVNRPFHSAISLSLVAVFIEAVASSSSPQRTSMSVRVMPKMSWRTKTEVSSVSPTRGCRRILSFRTLPM